MTGIEETSGLRRAVSETLCRVFLSHKWEKWAVSEAECRDGSVVRNDWFKCSTCGAVGSRPIKDTTP